MSACFATPVFYTTAGVFLFISGLFFFHEVASLSILASRLAQAQGTGGVSMNALLLGPLFSDLSTLVIFLCPLVTMGLFSRENALDLTSGNPVGDGRILLGKYLAALTILVALICLSAFLMVILALVASPDWGIAGSSFLGLVLLGGAVLSMGTCASAMTRHHATAAALTMGMALAFWTAGWFTPLFPGSGAGQVLQELSLSYHLSRFFQGIISPGDIFFYLELTVFFLALGLVALGSRREQGQAPAAPFTRILRNIIFFILLAFALFMIQLIILKHDVSANVSTTGDHRLDSRTENIIRRLRFDVEILAFEPAGMSQRWSNGLLWMFSEKSKHITFSVIDPDLRPAIARRYGITRYGQAVILTRGRTALLERDDEQELTNALLSLEQGRKKSIYVLSGHGEPDILSKARSGLSELRKSLERSGYGVHTYILAGKENLPPDADLLIIPGPRAAMEPGEISAVSSFIGRGGNVLMALEPSFDAGLKPLLSEMGVRLNSTVIRDPSSKALSGDESMLVVDSYGELKALDGFPHTTVFPTARPLSIEKKLPPKTTVSLVAQTSDKSRAAAQYPADGGHSEASGGDPSGKGPLNIALLVRKGVKNGTRPGIMVFGDVDFLTNAYLNVSGNRELAMACVGLLLQGNDYVAIDTRPMNVRPFILTPSQVLRVFLASVVILPLLVFLAGLLLHRRRGRA
jgi:hypothetical protein